MPPLQPLVPEPLLQRLADDVFHASPELIIIAEDRLRSEAEWLAGVLRRSTGWAVPVSAQRLPRCHVELRLAADLDPRGNNLAAHRIDVALGSIVIQGASPAGVFHACQTFRQLLPQECEISDALATGFSLKCCTVIDAPRFAWRGLLLDSAREFHPVEDVLEVLDVMAFYKLNRFHWHLTDDQGWRMPVPSWPNLVEKGSWRMLPDGTQTGGFYSRADLQRVVDHATKLHITIVPEFDMPGHTTAATVAYPELSCRGEATQLPKPGGNFPHVLCAGNPRVFDFIRDVLTEAASIFPGPFLHIGGDECVKRNWQTCPRCQGAMRELGLATEKELERHFIRRTNEIILGLGRRPVGWDETLELRADGIGHEVAVTYPATPAEDSLARQAVVQSWRDRSGVIAAARLGHDVIVSANDRVYLNYTERGLPLEHIYSFDPLPAELDREQARHVLGLETCLWEPSANRTYRWQRLLPRMCAVAERAWSPADRTDFAAFRQRLFSHRRRWQAWGLPSGALQAVRIKHAPALAVAGSPPRYETVFEFDNFTTEPVRATSSTGIALDIAPLQTRAVKVEVACSSPPSPDSPIALPVEWHVRTTTEDLQPVEDRRTLLVAPDPFRICSVHSSQTSHAIEPEGRSSFRVYRDANHVHIVVNVAGRNIQSSPDKLPWQQDGVEIRVDARDDDARYHCDGDFEFVDFLIVAVCPSDGSKPHGSVYRKHDLPTGIEFTCLPDACGYETKVAVPLSWLRSQNPSGLNRFRVNVAVNRPGEGGANLRTSWRPRWRSPENFPWSGTFSLE